MQPETDTTGSWAAALSRAAAAPALADAFPAACELLMPAIDATAAAMIGGTTRQPIAVWRCDADAVARRVADLPRPTGSFPAEAAPSDDPVRGPLRVEALGAADDPEAALLLVLPPPRAGAAPPALEGIVALTRLLLERDRLGHEARRAREIRDHFLVALHHELRTPATALMLEAGLARSGMLGELPPRLGASLARVEANVTELNRVVQRVLDLAQLEVEPAAERGDIVDPREVIVALGRLAEPEAERKGVGLSLFVPRVLPPIQTDEARFRRVLLYLIGNAVQFSDRGHVQIRIERSGTADGPAGAPVLMVRVLDAGRGIPAEELERVFEPFAQVEEGARTDSVARGLGLGLSLARRLARSIGGDVTVASEPGHGTTASFVLPYEPESLR